MKRLRSSEKSDEPVNSEQGQGMQLTTSSECSEDEKISSDMSSTTLELGMMLDSSSEAENAAGDAEALCSATIWGGGRRKKARSSRQVRRKTPPMLAFGR